MVYCEGISVILQIYSFLDLKGYGELDNRCQGFKEYVYTNSFLGVHHHTKIKQVRGVQHRGGYHSKPPGK